MNKSIPPFLLGFMALSYQVILLREFSVHFYGNEITFGLLLASWFLWGGIGSILSPRFRLNLKWFPQMYYLVIFLFPLSLLLLRLSRILLRTLPGEINGIFPMLFFSLGLTFVISFPLGVLFVFNALYLEGKIAFVYINESLGAAAAGLVVYFLLIPFFSNWQAASFIGAFAAVTAVFIIGKRKRHGLILLFILGILIAFGALDFFTQKLSWKPFALVQSKDTRYGKLQVIKTEEQISLYDNGLLVYSYPDPAASEESVHFGMLQDPEAENVLLIGGGAGGGLKELLKYPRTKVTYVELDPDIIHLSLEYLPDEEKEVLKSDRVDLFFQDGIHFLRETQNIYDLIILNVMEPVTAQINRFYTQEFFSEIKKKISTDGIFCFRIPSAENYISSELQNFLGSLYYTLHKVFPNIEIVPGSTNVFLASSRELSLDYDRMSQKIEDYGLQNLYVSPELLSSRLDPRRIKLLREKILEGKKTANLNLSPISYFYSSVLWSKQFKGFEAKIFTTLSEVSFFWLLDFPLILFLLLLVLLGIKRKKTTFHLLPLAVMGLTTIVVEIITIISFQAYYGYVYKRIALLFASFMFGLFLGALAFMKREKKYSQILLIQAGFILLLILGQIMLMTLPLEFLFYLFLISLGLLGGALFVASNHLFLENKKNYGVGYGLDLLGSFLGALAASTFLIPLVGLPLLLKYLLLLNSFCLVFLVWGRKAN